MLGETSNHNNIVREETMTEAITEKVNAMPCDIGDSNTNSSIPSNGPQDPTSISTSTTATTTTTTTIASTAAIVAKVTGREDETKSNTTDVTTEEEETAKDVKQEPIVSSSKRSRPAYKYDPNKITLRFLFANRDGLTVTIECEPTDTVGEVKGALLSVWPEGTFLIYFVDSAIACTLVLLKHHRFNLFFLIFAACFSRPTSMFGWRQSSTCMYGKRLSNARHSHTSGLSSSYLQNTSDTRQCFS
jgi:hypothetical protein